MRIYSRAALTRQYFYSDIFTGTLKNVSGCLKSGLARSPYNGPVVFDPVGITKGALYVSQYCTSK